MQKWIILGIIIAIIIIGAIVISNVDIETEYTPESEIEEVELRKTIVSLYFKNKETAEIAKETRLIDSKELLLNPYKILIDMLIEGPENSSFERVLPEEVTVLETNIENGCVSVNLSSEFEKAEDKDFIIETIERTLKELTEVTSVKILIEGHEIQEDGEIVENTVSIENETSENAIITE